MMQKGTMTKLSTNHCLKVRFCEVMADYFCILAGRFASLFVHGISYWFGSYWSLDSKMFDNGEINDLYLLMGGFNL